MRVRTSSAPSKGFSLIEVMVALIVISVGLLGIAKLEAVAFSSTNNANLRSLAAIQAASLAAAMHENRGYWTTADAAGGTITVTAGAVAVTTAAPNLAAAVAVGPNCRFGFGFDPCSPVNLAANDLIGWGAGLQLLMKGTTSTISCGTASPVSCTINITWGENSVAANQQEAAAKAAAALTANPNMQFETPSYTLYVQP